MRTVKQEVKNAYRHAPSYAVPSQVILDLGNLKNIKNLDNKIFERRAKIFLAVMKAQWEEGDGRILLNDDTGGGMAMLRPTRFLCAGFGIQDELPYLQACIYSWPDA